MSSGANAGPEGWKERRKEGRKVWVFLRGGDYLLVWRELRDFTEGRLVGLLSERRCDEWRREPKQERQDPENVVEY